MNELNGLALIIEAEFWKSGNLALINCTTGKKHILDTANCYGACFSPDGKKAAYCKDGVIYTINIDGSGKDEITFVVGNMYLNWVKNNHIYFTQRTEKTLYRVSVERKIREVVFTSSHFYLNNISVSQSGRQAAWSSPTYVHEQKPTYKVRTWDLMLGKSPDREIGDGAQGSVSPDGSLVTRGIEGHKEMALHHFSDGSEYKRISPPEGEFNTNRFSHGSNDHVVYTLFKTFKSYVHNIRTNEAFNVGTGVITDFYPL